MNVLSKLIGLGQELQAATHTVTENLAELREAIDAKKAERDLAQHGPLPPGEVVEKFNRWVDETAGEQREKYGASLVVHRFGAAPRSHLGRSPWTSTTAVEWGFLAMFAGAQLKEQFSKLVKETAYQAGPPAAERPAEVARLESELAELEKAEEALVDEMNAAGIHVGHRPDVVQRREAARRREERIKAVRAAQAEREALIDQRHANRGRAMPSPYLVLRSREGA